MAEHAQTIDVESLYRFDMPALSVERFSDIGEKELDQYRELGYLVVRQAFSPEEVKNALAGLLDLIDGKNPEFTGVHFESWAEDRLAKATRVEKQDYVRKISRFVEYDDRLLAISQHPELLKVVKTIIGDDPQLFQDMALIKPPGGGREKPWHQDKAYFNVTVDTPIVGVWIALDPATAENGCMHVLPGTHREGPVVHFKRRDWQICDTEVQVNRDVYVPLPPGGALFFDGLIHHGTAPNHSQSRRRALQYHYAGVSVVQTSQQDRLAIYGGEGLGVEC